MKNDYRLFWKSLSAMLFIWVMISAGGCQKEVADTFDPVFFPPAPNQPRLQFLTSFQDASEFNFEKPSFLESFVLGEGESTVAKIERPYGGRCPFYSWRLKKRWLLQPDFCKIRQSKQLYF